MKKRAVFYFTLIIFTMIFSIQALPALADSPEILNNPGFEDDITGWQACVTATLITQDNGAQKGKYYMYANNRYGYADGPGQYVEKKVSFYGKGTYHVSAWAKLAGEHSTGTAQIVMQTVSSDKTFGANTKDYPGMYWVTTDKIDINNKTWVKLEGDLKLDWGGNLDKCLFYIVTSEDVGKDDICVDECSLIKTGYTGASYTSSVTSSADSVSSDSPKASSSVIETVTSASSQISASVLTQPDSSTSVSSSNASAESTVAVNNNNNNYSGIDYKVILIIIAVILIVGGVTVLVVFNVLRKKKKR